MTARLTMTQRATISRDDYSSPTIKLRPEDPYGRAETQHVVVTTKQPCRLMESSKTLVLDPTKASAVIIYRLFVPLKADVMIRDCIEKVVDRRGREITDGPMYVDQILRYRKFKVAVLEGA